MSRVFFALRTRPNEDFLPEITSTPARRIACKRYDLRPRRGLMDVEGRLKSRPEIDRGGDGGPEGVPVSR